MTTWTKYPKSDGYYMNAFGLVLTAWPNGSWSVHDPKGRVRSITSQAAPILYGPRTEEEALADAQEQAFLAAMSMRPYEPIPLPDGI